MYSALKLDNAWYQLYKDSAVSSQGTLNSYLIKGNRDFMKLGSIWMVNYTLLFVSVLAMLNLKKIKNAQLGVLSFGLIAVAIGYFLTVGLFEISELRQSYLNPTQSITDQVNTMHLSIRYVSLLFLAIAIAVVYQFKEEKYLPWDFQKTFDALLFITIIWVASSELIHWLDIDNSEKMYKLGLSILWGVYALAIVSLGIWKSKQYLRVGAIVLFGLTLVKVFFYDLSDLNTISKTIVFISLGILLLIISYLYNKYMDKIVG